MILGVIAVTDELGLEIDARNGSAAGDAFAVFDDGEHLAFLSGADSFEGEPGRR